MEAFPFLHQILHTKRVDRHVIVWIQICDVGTGACSPDFLLKKDVVIFSILSVPKTLLPIEKSTILRIINTA